VHRADQLVDQEAVFPHRHRAVALGVEAGADFGASGGQRLLEGFQHLGPPLVLGQFKRHHPGQPLDQGAAVDDGALGGNLGHGAPEGKRGKRIIGPVFRPMPRVFEMLKGAANPASDLGNAVLAR